MQVKRLLKQQPDSGSAIHAVTTPPVKALQLVWRKADMGWIAKSHGAGRGACTL